MSLQEITARIEAAEEKAGRARGSTCLIAVSKVQPEARILAVLEAGHRVFGENRVQEAEDKWPDLKAAFPDTVLHLVGPLQSNKARRAVELFEVIETVDRPKLARALARIDDLAAHLFPRLLEVDRRRASVG